MLSSRSVSLVFCKAIVTKLPSQLHLLSDVSMSMMGSIECKGEAKFHSVTDMNHEQEGEVLDLVEMGGSNPSLRLYNGAPIPTCIYTNETVRAVCTKAFLPEPVCVSLLNECARIFN